MKKRFPCGHTGKGAYCHRCAQAGLEAERRQEDAAAKAEWERSFEADPLDLRGLPKRALVLKTRDMIRRIAAGEQYTSFKGKRLHHDRSIISIPLNRDYRLIYRDTPEGLQLLELLTHEQYNVKKPGDKSH